MTTETLNLAALTLGQMNPIMINLLVGGFLVVSVIMILIVLIQRPQGGGLGGAFGAGGGGGSGGGGAGQTAFGTKTGDVLTGATIAIFVLFLVFAVVLNFVTRPPKAPSAQPRLVAPDSTEPIPVDEVPSEKMPIDETPVGDAPDSDAPVEGDVPTTTDDVTPDDD